MAIKEYVPQRDRSSSTDSSVAQVNKRKCKIGSGSRTNWINLGGDLLPSAKTTAIKLQVERWLKEDPTTKIIIYTQFLQM